MAKKMTQWLSARVAENMANQAFDSQIEAKRIELKDFATTIVTQQLSGRILDLSKDLEVSKFLNYTSSIMFEEIGSDRNPIHTQCHSIPCSKTNRPLYQASSFQIATIEQLEREIENLRTRKLEARTATRNTLQQLGSFKRIKESFPEAYAFIPKEEIDVDPSVALAIPIENVKQLLGLQ